MLKSGFYFVRSLSKLPIQNTYQVSTEYVTKGQVQIFGFLICISNLFDLPSPIFLMLSPQNQTAEDQADVMA